jgi:hypothetical protein
VPTSMSVAVIRCSSICTISSIAEAIAKDAARVQAGRVVRFTRAVKAGPAAES